jgi:hypothetical protein
MNFIIKFLEGMFNDVKKLADNKTEFIILLFSGLVTAALYLAVIWITSSYLFFYSWNSFLAVITSFTEISFNQAMAGVVGIFLLTDACK